MRLVVLALFAGLLAGGLALPAGAAAATGPSSHYVPKTNDAFTFAETISVSGGYGNYSGYTETDTITGALNVTATATNGTETAHYHYAGRYVNSSGGNYPWSSQGNFTFSSSTYDYVHGTDNQTGLDGAEVWFYTNNSTSVGRSIDPLETPLTVRSLDQAFALDAGSYTDVATIYAAGTGTYVRDDSYGEFNATYVWREYFDPGTGYIVAYDYSELDANGRGDGFVYTDVLAVTSTTYPLTPATAPLTYAVAFSETGLPDGTSWTVTFDGRAASATDAVITVAGVPNGTYLWGTRLDGYAGTPSVGYVTVQGGDAAASVTFSATASGSTSDAWIVYAVVAVIVIVVVVVIAVAAARRARRGPPLPRHSSTGQLRYVPPPPGPAPPPISLRPADQPQIQQVVVKEVVKVNCRYCGSLIDSTAERCPFCGATRS